MVILKGAGAAACQREDEETELQDLRTSNVNYLQWEKQALFKRMGYK